MAGRRMVALWSRPRLARPAVAFSWPLGVAAVALATALLRWPYLDVPISADEGGYATAAYWWARGDTLYQHITITRPQGIFVIYRLIQALGLGSVRGIHLFASAYTALVALALLAVVALRWGRGVGLSAAALFGLLMATPYVEGYQANAELFMLLPLLLSLYALLRADSLPLASARCRWLLAGSGLLAAVALLVKPSGVVALVLAALWLARRWWTERATWRVWFGAELALGMGFAAGVAPALVHGLLTAPDMYLNAVLFYRMRYDSVLVGGTAGNAATNSIHVLGSLAPVALLAVVGMAGDWKVPARRDGLGLWLATSVGGMALGGGWFLHYYVQLVPPLAVAAVLGARWLWRWPDGYAVAALQGLAGATACVWLLVAAPAFVQPANPASLPEYEPVMAAAGAVAEYLRSNTAPDERIYVAYDHADIYYLARRRPAARWLYFRELTRVPGAFDEQLALLEQPATAPRYIVGAQDFTRWGLDNEGKLRALLARDYAPAVTIAGVPLYRRIR